MASTPPAPSPAWEADAGPDRAMLAALGDYIEMHGRTPAKVGTRRLSDPGVDTTKLGSWYGKERKSEAVKVVVARAKAAHTAEVTAKNADAVARKTARRQATSRLGRRATLTIGTIKNKTIVKNSRGSLRSPGGASGSGPAAAL